jgi:hypothetical protein
MKLLRLAVLTLSVATAAIACTDSTNPTPPPPPVPPPPPPPPAPPPGSAIVTLTTPVADDGAVVVRVQGPGLTTLQTASSGYTFYSRLAGEQDARVIVLGNLVGGPMFTFKMATGASAADYTATLEQVASRADALRAAHTNYSLTITATP